MDHFKIVRNIADNNYKVQYRGLFKYYDIFEGFETIQEAYDTIEKYSDGVGFIVEIKNY